jgi:predicted HTH transcriptional regulator
MDLNSQIEFYKRKLLLRENGLQKPIFEQSGGYFRVIFNRPEKVGETTPKTVEKTVEKILQLIKENQKITQEELAEKTGLTRRGVEWNLAQLKEKGILKRVGADKGGYWEVKK